MRGQRVCRVHGGKTPRGIASPHYKTGRYSRSIPARLADRYEESRNDPRLLDLQDEIGLLDARLTDLLARVDTGESGAIWRDLMQQRSELLAAKRANDIKAQAEAIGAILDLISKGHADYRAWGEVHTVLEQRKRLAESERKRMIEMQQMITSERAMALLGAVVGVVREHVQDRSVLNAISTGIDNLLLAGPDA
jgi:hypothetical protein